MPAEILVQRKSDFEYEVTVREGSGETHHMVTVEPAFLRRLAGGTSAEDLLRRSFEFLLAREPKESILRDFHLREISRYFPEYEKAIRESP